MFLTTCIEVCRLQVCLHDLLETGLSRLQRSFEILWYIVYKRITREEEVTLQILCATGE